MMDFLYRFTTESGSTYEVDYSKRKMRRLEGKQAPTPRQGVDGEWQKFVNATLPSTGQSVIFVWSYEESADDGLVAKSTLTSRVTCIWFDGTKIEEMRDN